MSCEKCQKNFKTLRLLKQHERTHNTICEKCNITFKSHNHLKQHTRDHHPKMKDFKCRVCPDSVFVSEKEYLLHVRDYHEGKIIESHMCSDCGKTFRTGSELSLHMKSKCGTEKQYICKECGKKMMSPGSLYTHLKRHKGNLNFMCRFCAKRFLTSGQLKVHERKHTKQKDFVCDICSKGFCHRQSLITHISVHTGIKPYQCEGCGKSFSCISNLLKHRKSHKTTCGTLPMTSHRVKNPATKIKLRINTPESSKLKRAQMKKELEMKFAELDEEIKEEDIENTVLEKSEADDKNPVKEEVQAMSCGTKKSIPEETDLIEAKNEPIDTNFDEDRINNIEENKFGTETEENNLSVDKNPHEIEETLRIHSKETKPEQYSPKKTTRKKNPHQIQNEVFSGDIKKCDLNNGNFDVEDFDMPDEIESDISEIESEEEYKPNIRKRKGKPRQKKRRDQFLDSDIQKFIRERNLVKGVMGHCQYCSKGYTSFGCLYKHEQEHSNSQNSSKESKTASHKCSCCRMVFETSEEVKNHQHANHADILSCPECPDRIFSRPDYLKLHRDNYHKGVPRKHYVYICDKCGKKFRAKCLLTHHETTDCGKSNKDGCHICHKQFSNQYTLKAHMVVHSAEKKLACAFCGKTFHWKGQLKVHERSHTGEKPYTCLFCPSSFAYRDSLIRHSSLHTGVKPYLCKCCGWRFSCIGNLIKHKVTHATSCGAWYKENDKETTA
ncbi:unnamed protein product [Phaedon cochleariae]|uniref:C2H2-type domain-containing protein n=1 Tax=Phaedon cochleariae TaxID=80249 RepID=A0A9N9SFG9_PHACE|nr:unnamed protein product [Phaedon cochleariae]